MAVLRTAPFEDLGFARIDTHREIRTGFPEVILGLGKSPAQIAAIAERIVSRGQALLPRRFARGGVRGSWPLIAKGRANSRRK